MIVLETERLVIREFGEEDAGFVLRMLNEPAFLRNVGDRGVRTAEDAAKYIRERILTSYRDRGYGMWLVHRNSQPIGTCGLLKRPEMDDVEIGFSFLEEFWSQGYALEAAARVMEYGWNTAGLARIVAIVVPDNSSSIRLLEKLGFKYEKMIRLTPEAAEVMLYQTTRPRTTDEES